MRLTQQKVNSSYFLAFTLLIGILLTNCDIYDGEMAAGQANPEDWEIIIELLYDGENDKVIRFCEFNIKSIREQRDSTNIKIEVYENYIKIAELSSLLSDSIVTSALIADSKKPA